MYLFIYLSFIIPLSFILSLILGERGFAVLRRLPGPGGATAGPSWRWLGLHEGCCIMATALAMASLSPSSSPAASSSSPPSSSPTLAPSFLVNSTADDDAASSESSSRHHSGGTSSSGGSGGGDHGRDDHDGWQSTDTLLVVTDGRPLFSQSHAALVASLRESPLLHVLLRQREAMLSCPSALLVRSFFVGPSAAQAACHLIPVFLRQAFVVMLCLICCWYLGVFAFRFHQRREKMRFLRKLRCMHALLSCCVHVA